MSQQQLFASNLSMTYKTGILFLTVVNTTPFRCSVLHWLHGLIYYFSQASLSTRSIFTIKQVVTISLAYYLGNCVQICLSS